VAESAAHLAARGVPAMRQRTAVRRSFRRYRLVRRVRRVLADEHRQSDEDVAR
jgi:hypothetical protein